MQYEPVMGLEIHAQLLTKSKIFCGCSTRFGGSPNTHTCQVCLGMPGVLPVPQPRSRRIHDHGWPLTHRLHTVARTASSRGKTTSIPTLPKEYQNFPVPNCPWPGTDGLRKIETSGGIKRVRIHRIHMVRGTPESTSMTNTNPRLRGL